MVSSNIDISRATQIKEILDSSVFRDTLDNLKADLLIQTTVIDDSSVILDLHKQIKAISIIVGRLESDYSLYNGE